MSPQPEGRVKTRGDKAEATRKTTGSSTLKRAGAAANTENLGKKNALEPQDATPQEEKAEVMAARSTWQT